MSSAPILYTIGHSNHAIEAFVGLLASHQIETVIDVRSWPASRRLPHFNRAPLQQSLAAAGIAYLWFGKELGGKTELGKSAPAFRTRIAELSTLAGQERTAMLCAEEDPLRCHRKKLLAPPLSAEGLELMHIRGDGGLISDAALDADKRAQYSLFAEN